MLRTRRQLIRDASAASMAAMLLRAPHVSAASPDKVKLGMIGTGHAHAAGKLDAARRLTDLFDVVGVVEPDPRRRASVEGKKDYAGVRWMSEQELLNHPGLNAVLVETTVIDLVPTAARVASAGMHIHLDKPAGPSLPAFAAVMKRMAEKQRVLQLGYMFRGNPAFEFCFKAVRDGLLGHVYEVNGVMGKVIAPAERKSLAQFSGGMMFELGCHLIDATVTVLGKPKAVKPELRQTRPDQDTLADNTLAVFEYDKALATIRSAAMDVVGGARRQFTIAGDRGTLHLQPLEPSTLMLTLAEPAGGYTKGTQPVELRKINGRYGDQLTRFAKVIRGEAELDYSPTHELTVQETVLRASGMPTDA